MNSPLADRINAATAEGKNDGARIIRAWKTTEHLIAYRDRANSRQTYSDGYPTQETQAYYIAMADTLNEELAARGALS